MPAAVSQTLDTLLPVVLSLFAAALTVLGTSLIRRLQRFLDTQETATLERAWSKLVEEAVAYAESRARSYLKARAQAAPSSQKLEWALGYVSHEAPERGLELLDAASLGRRIEACLGDPRTPGGAPPAECERDTLRPVAPAVPIELEAPAPGPLESPGPAKTAPIPFKRPREG